MPDEKVNIELTKEEAIVFFEFLGRFNENDDLSRFEDQAEQWGDFVIFDDFNAFQFWKKTVLDYCLAHEIKEDIIEIDKETVFWRKER